jgi:hypothetical protein
MTVKEAAITGVYNHTNQYVRFLPTHSNVCLPPQELKFNTGRRRSLNTTYLSR